MDDLQRMEPASAAAVDLLGQRPGDVGPTRADVAANLTAGEAELRIGKERPGGLVEIGVGAAHQGVLQRPVLRIGADVGDHAVVATVFTEGGRTDRAADCDVLHAAPLDFLQRHLAIGRIEVQR